MLLELKAEEVLLLRELLESAYRDLKEEIYKTEDQHYKALLKERERLLVAVLGKLSRTETTAPSL